MTDLSQIEYKTLRETIRERGTLRMCAILIGLAVWGALALTLQINDLAGAATMVPFVILAGTFELNLFIHTSVERIGRYLQVFHERDGGWEHVAMAFGQQFPGSGPDPLFGRMFVIAVSVNYLPVVLGGETTEMVVLAVLHLILIGRIRYARGVAAKQRALDLERFETLFQAARTAGPATEGPSPR